MKILSKIFIAMLCIAFCYCIVRSYLNVLQEPTTFEEIVLPQNTSLPSLTFCRLQWTNDTFEKVGDIVHAIGQADGFSTTLKVRGKGKEFKDYNLKNPAVLKSEWNVSYHEVWNHAPYMQYDWPYPIVICTTLNFPFIKSPPSYGYLGIRINVQNADGLLLTKHENGQSFHTFGLDVENNAVLQTKTGISEVFTTILTTSLKKSKFDCYEDNSMQVTKCINEYIAEQMDCCLPWAKRDCPKQITKDECRGTEKLKLFRNISFYISTEHKRALEIKGCFKPNCESKVWKKIYEDRFLGYFINTTSVELAVTDKSMTLHRKEILIADFSTFLADCGSYLGLFLGASILTISEAGATLTKRIALYLVKKFKNKTRIREGYQN